MTADIEERLEAKGIKPTAMRKLVLDYLLLQNSAISLTELEKALSPVDRITVYRTLKTFEEHGLVHSIEDGTASKYAVCVEDCNKLSHQDLHVHFSCNNCNDTYCLPNTLIPILSLPSGFIGEEVSLIVKGLCQKCSA
jgi:Fur family ferric uptake transcriptional regulator